MSTLVTAARPVVTVPTTWPITHGPASPTTEASRCHRSTHAQGPAVLAEQDPDVLADHRARGDRQRSGGVVGALDGSGDISPPPRAGRPTGSRGGSGEVAVRAGGDHPTVGHEVDHVGVVEQQRARGDDDRRAPAAGARRAGRRSGPRCGRRRRWSARRARGPRRRAAARGPARAVGAGPRERAAALLELAVEPLVDRLEGVRGVGHLERGEPVRRRPDRRARGAVGR